MAFVVILGAGGRRDGPTLAGGVVIAVLHGYPGQPGRRGVVGLGSGFFGGPGWGRDGQTEQQGEEAEFHGGRIQ